METITQTKEILKKRIIAAVFTFFIAVAISLCSGFNLSVPQAFASTEDYTYKLTQSTGSYEFWTTPPSERVFQNDAVPTDTDTEVKVYAAKNEFEPFQIVVKPASSGSVTVNIGSFGAGISTEIFQVKYVDVVVASDALGKTGPYPDPLRPLENGDSVSLTAGENTTFWFSVYVPPSAAAGDYPMNVTIGGVAIPVTLHVFNFMVPEDLHVKSQMNFSHETILNKYGASCCGTEYWTYVDKIKQWFIDHRLTPKGPLWSGGLTGTGGGPYIDYDCATKIFTDNDNVWGFEEPALRYLDGTGLMDTGSSNLFTQTFNNGTGFPSFMTATFRNNDASADQRPDEMCAPPITRTAADWYLADNPSSPYNQQWFSYITAMQGYLTSLGYLDKAYYYFANEPQDQDDYDAVAWYSQHLKAAAPNLKLMLSEEPKPDIYNHATHTGAKIDIWLPVMQNYDPAVSHDRETNHSEETWIYWLHSTRPPYYNPITLDHPGIESKFTGWYVWKYRLKGIAYYSLNNWGLNPWTADPRMGTGHNGDMFMFYPPSASGDGSIAYGANNHRFVPSIRFELMRDSLEDYEYFYMLNGNAQPQVGTPNAADTQVDKVITGLAGYTRNSEFMYNLRRLVGLYIGGEIPSIPDIQPPVAHPRAEGAPGNYYINFQDPEGLPTTSYTEDTYGNGYMYKYVEYPPPPDPGSHEYLQAGVEQYDETAGYGWLDDTTNFLTGRDPWGAETDERKRTYAFDNWAHHPSVFEFDLPNGTYDVTVSVGRPRTVDNHNRVVIEGVTFIDDEVSNMYIIRTMEVTVTDSKLTVDVGIWGYYCMLDYLDIETKTTPALLLWTR